MTKATKVEGAAAARALWSHISGIPVGADGFRPLTAAQLKVVTDRLGMSRTWGPNTLRAWEKEGRLTPKRTKGSGATGEVLIGVVLANDERGRSAPTSIKDRLMNYLLREVTSNGKVSQASMEKAAAHLGVNNHDVMKVMFDLRRAGIVTFKEDRNGSATWLKDVRLMESRFHVSGARVTQKQPWVLCDECWWEARYHATAGGEDDPDWGRCPSPPKTGSPMFQRLTAEGMANAGKDAPDAKRGDHPARAITNPAKRAHPVGIIGRGGTPAPGPVTSLWRCSQCDPPKDFQWEIGLIQHRQKAHPPVEDEATGLLPSTEQPKGQPIQKVIDWDRYDAIVGVYDAYRHVMDQRAKLERAIKALRDADERDVAETLRVKMENEHPEPPILHLQIVLLMEALGYEKEKDDG